MSLTILSSVACPALPYSSTFSQKTATFSGGWGEVIGYEIWVLIFSTNSSEIFLVLRRIERDIINVHRPSCKAPVILVRF